MADPGDVRWLVAMTQDGGSAAARVDAGRAPYRLGPNAGRVGLADDGRATDCNKDWPGRAIDTR